MNETHIEPVNDIAKKRREYLRKVSVATAAVGTAGILSIAGILIAAIMWLGIYVFLNYYAMGHFRPSRSSADTKVQAGILLVLSSLAVGLISGLICRDQLRKKQEIEYVPPVAEQIAALPAEEILLRGSDQPAATSGELLRATHSATETAPEELLRPTENRTT